MDKATRYAIALQRLADDKPMMKGKETGISSLECKARILYTLRVLETSNRNDAIELGVIAEMESQSSDAPVVSETLLGEHPLDQGHDEDEG